MPTDAAKTNATTSPDWLETPEPDDYNICMFSDGATIDVVDVDRSEYLALKHHLAAMRGHGHEEQMREFSANEPDEQQLAFRLEDAQDFYRKCPALVMGAMPPEWKELCSIAWKPDDGPEDARIAEPPSDLKQWKLSPIILNSLSDHRRGLLDSMFTALEQHGGYTTPAEEFIIDVLRLYADKDGLTPADAIGLADDFKENFDYVLRDTKIFCRQYPDLIKATAQPESAR